MALSGCVLCVTSFKDGGEEVTYDELKATARASGATVSGILHRHVFALVATVSTWHTTLPSGLLVKKYHTREKQWLGLGKSSSRVFVIIFFPQSHHPDSCCHPRDPARAQGGFSWCPRSHASVARRVHFKVGRPPSCPSDDCHRRCRCCRSLVSAESLFLKLLHSTHSPLTTTTHSLVSSLIYPARTALIRRATVHVMSKPWRLKWSAGWTRGKNGC